MDFELAGNQYRSSKLNAFEQLHISRKLGVLLPKVFAAFVTLKDGQHDFASMANLMAPALEEFASMPKDDLEYVFSTCLNVVKRQVGNKWAPIWSASNNMPMFEDLELDVLTQLVFKVVGDNLGNFIRALLAKIQAQPDQDQTAA